MAHDGSGTGWDTNAPANADPIKDAAQEIRDLRLAMGIRVNKEHETLAASSAGGRHKEGSARGYYAGSAPTLQPDGSTALGSSDDGRIWTDSDDMCMYVWTGSAWAKIALNSADQLAADIVTTAKIINGAVTTDKLGADAVTGAKIADDAVDTEHIVDAALSADATGRALMEDGFLTLPKLATGLVAGRAAVIEERTAANTHAVAATVNTWTDRELSDIIADPDSIVTSLSTNQITLPAGSYWIEASVPGYDCDEMRAKLITSAGALLLEGTTEYMGAAGNSSGRSMISGRITLASPTAIKLQFRCKAVAGSGANGGRAANIDSLEEIYSRIAIWKESA